MKTTTKKPARKAAKAKRPLTPRQRLAIDRRAADRACAESLERIRRSIGGEDGRGCVPPNYRATVARALNVILDHGHLFVIACAKAGIVRTWPMPGINDAELWRFIDEQNALFAERMAADMVERWNAPDYRLPAGGNEEVA